MCKISDRSCTFSLNYGCWFWDTLFLSGHGVRAFVCNLLCVCGTVKNLHEIYILLSVSVIRYNTSTTLVTVSGTSSINTTATFSKRWLSVGFTKLMGFTFFVSFSSCIVNFQFCPCCRHQSTRGPPCSVPHDVRAALRLVCAPYRPITS